MRRKILQLLSTSHDHGPLKQWISVATATASVLMTGYCLDSHHKDNQSQSSGHFTTQCQRLVAPARTLMDASNNNNTPKVLEYDFIVLGHGNAGAAAVETLRTKCPFATIAVVDPFQSPTPQTATSNSSSYNNNNNNKVHYFAQSVLGFHPPTQMVQLVHSDSTVQQLQYHHSILIATGVRGAPPPNMLVDQKAMPRLLELRPTSISLGTPNHERPALAPHVTKHVCELAASQGAKVAILGSGWDAMELALAIARKATVSPILTFGAPGPLCFIVPRYLSTSITKRLQTHGIDVRDRTLIRYLSHNDMDGNLELHTTRTFDLLDTKRHHVDLVVVAPSVDGPRGTAVLPSLALSHHAPSSETSSSWYQSWSQLTAPPFFPSMCVCYADDGRVMVNAELHVASNVYAAGSVAKYPNSLTGHGHVAGEGTVDGKLAGRVAALHMARDYQERQQGVLFGDRKQQKKRQDMTLSFAAESFPIWRSDMCFHDACHSTSLSSVGVEALCVGVCDSEKMTTHGFWWTNQAANVAGLRERKLSRRHTKETTTDTTFDVESIRERKLTQRLTKKINTDTTLPVYGVGAVFYFDRSGRVCGVMIWGLPFTGDRKEELNEKLLNRMKDFITSNGNITNYKQEESAHLMPRHLAEESKLLVQLALDGKKPTNYCLRRLHGISIKDMPRPLHQYTAAKPSVVQTMGRLRRDGQARNSEVLGENLYIKDEDEALDGNIRPSSLVYVYPLRPRSTTSRDDWKNPFELTEKERIAEAWEENDYRARPPKEEPLWLRPGEASRISNVQNKMLDMFLSNMKKGVFSDGSDPIGRPEHIPSPDFVIRVSDRFRSWMKSEAATKNPDKDNDPSSSHLEHADELPTNDKDS